MISDLEKAQMKVLGVENANIMKDIRRLQIELDELRQANSTMLEAIMKNVDHENININLSTITGNWLASYCTMQILGLSSKYQQTKKNHESEDPNLKRQLDEIKVKNTDLKENKESLILELRSLQEETNKEKEYLRKYIENETQG
ncbi:hypothetical protein GPJ56_003591 [Histomonas meleagridis]|uniref:uncharacterized protein n=1 Tax=Histomonas meleagridis TaxID=135588 RepID=UPI003559AE95|nr:hypothetical protein GPJ56_003591 [Histomonas meleagridis]KAH0800661.1 hypothetical protein GO595_006414 [Histomonas meleagridis]